MSRDAVYPSLAGRVVFVSGGASGIGAAFVRRFAAQGARVAFVDLDQDAGRTLADETSGHFERCDVTDVAALRHAIERAAEKLGPIGALINNAARDDRHDALDLTPEGWDAAMAVNLRHQFFAAQAVIPIMRAAGGGVIVNMGSVSWMRGRPGFIAYATAKAAINGMTRSLAREVGPWNIRVNALVPGAILTERQERLWLTPELNQSFLDAQCLKFRLNADDVARMALFLASDEARGLTGQNFLVDAGIV
jgi:NAD(P)-dependent dehydrogenase (short-subunit alcohol dehydrogenase family)